MSRYDSSKRASVPANRCTAEPAGHVEQPPDFAAEPIGDDCGRGLSGAVCAGAVIGDGLFSDSGGEGQPGHGLGAILFLRWVWESDGEDGDEGDCTGAEDELRSGDEPANG